MWDSHIIIHLFQDAFWIDYSQYGAAILLYDYLYYKEITS